MTSAQLPPGTTALEVRSVPTPTDNYRQATDVAGVCREIVARTAKKIGGHGYVCVEGWEAIATAHGCVASIRAVNVVEGGIEAIAELRKIDTGVAICSASGFVGDDEPIWAARKLYARRAMAQTRAISRVCRSAFAHVVVLIDSNLSTTPAEEIDDEPEPPRNGHRPTTHTEPRISGLKAQISSLREELFKTLGVIQESRREALWKEIMVPLKAARANDLDDAGLARLMQLLQTRIAEAKKTPPPPGITYEQTAQVTDLVRVELANERTAIQTEGMRK